MNKNTKKLIVDKKLTIEELQEAWENSEDDIKISDTGGVYNGRKLIVPAKPDGNPNFFAIAQWMRDNGYFPNVWLINDHGNVELLSLAWNGHPTYHGGLV